MSCRYMNGLHDVITIGRVGVDLYPNQSGIHLSEVTSFSRFLGGTATNVAVAAARYGHRVAVITKVGADPFGDYVRSALGAFGVDASFVGTDPDLRTPIVFCELHPPDHFPLLFYREPKAPDMNLRADELPIEAVANARILWTTGTALSDEPSRAALLAALRARPAGATNIHDLDYRPMFWPSYEEASRWQRKTLELVSVAVGNRAEVAVAVGETDPEDQAKRLIDRFGLESSIVKLGPDGVLVATSAGRVERVPAVDVDVVNGLGAGDAFGGALCHGLLEGWDLVDTVRFANAAGAYVAARLACADAMPTEVEVRRLMSGG